MLTTTYHSEQWDLMNRGVDDQGRALCHVRRVTFGGHATVWRLVLYPRGWRNVGQFIGGLKGYRPSPEKNGVALSGSRTDLTLLSFAEHGHGNAYA